MHIQFSSICLGPLCMHACAQCYGFTCFVSVPKCAFIFFLFFLFLSVSFSLCRVSREGFFRHRMIDRYRQIQTDRQTNRERDGHRMMDRQSERQTARGTERERQTDTESLLM